MLKNSTSLYQSAINILNYREHSRLELQRKLLTKTDDVDAVNKILDKLIELDLLNETRFVEAYIHMRRNRGYGPVRIRAELRERGIGAELISTYLHEHDAQWQSHAESVIIKKFGKKSPKDYVERARQMRFLQYRGFKT